MKGYPKIGTTYLLQEQNQEIGLLWAVVENDSNFQTTKLEVVIEGPDFGRQVVVATSWLKKQENFGIFIEPVGTIIRKDGVEYVTTLLMEEPTAKKR